VDGSAGADERYDATEISVNAFRVLGQRPMLGRDFTAADETPTWCRRTARSVSIG
jgi:hypothetical protein